MEEERKGIGSSKKTELFPSLALGITLWTVSPSVMLTLPSFKPLWQILRLFSHPFLEPVLFMATFCHFSFCSRRDLNQDGEVGKAGLAPKKNVTSPTGVGTQLLTSGSRETGTKYNNPVSCQNTVSARETFS